MWDNIFKQVDLLQKGLEASWTRGAVIRNNIANVETPGFKSSDVEFESLLAQALEGSGFNAARTHPKHISFGSGDVSSVSARIVENNGTSMRMDGNNVDIESENVKLAQNSLYYNTVLAKMNSEISRIRTAISDTK